VPGVATPLAASGQTQSVTFTAPAPGTYRFVCTIHVKQGQTGKLVVLPN
jgi:plastocyanin